MRAGRASYVWLLVLAGIYVALAKLGFLVAVAAEQVTLVWLPSGLSLAALVLFGRRLWPGVFLGALIANATTSAPLWTAGAIAVGNTLEAVLGAWLLQRVGFSPRIRRLRDAVALIGLAGFGSTAVSASVGASVLCVADVRSWDSFATLWRDWWVGDAVGELVLAPLLLTWSGVRRGKPGRRDAAEMVALLAAIGAACVLSFGLSDAFSRAYPLHLFVFPVVIWSALRMGPRGTSTVVFVTMSVAVGATVMGYGYFTAGFAEDRLLTSHLLTVVVAATSLLLSGAIAERDDTHAALRVAEGQHQLALDAAKIGNWDWNVRTGEVRWSRNLEALHGLSAGTFGGTFEAFEALIHPEDREFVRRAVAAALERDANFNVEFRQVQHDGMHWMLGKGGVLRNSSGDHVHLIGIGMDVTERRRMEEELRTRVAQLAEQDRRKDEFLAILSHELRNPLAPVTSALALLEHKRHDPETVESLRRVIERQIWHLVRLVDDLLEVARISTGKIQLRKERVELRRMVDAAVEAAQPLVKARSQRLEVQAPEPPILLDADPTRLSQVISNLLNNASAYTPEGGHILLTLACEGDNAVLSVRDDGLGMSNETLTRAFDLFARGGPPEHPGAAGLGVGLALVRRLVEMHGGSVSARSDGRGHGTEVTVQLPGAQPARGPESIAHQATTVSAVAGGGPRRILVVDDNADAAEMLGALLQLYGHRVGIAHDGEQALEQAKESLPEIVLLDLGLPGMDGFQVAQALRKDPSTRGARIVAVSGYGRAEDRARTERAGFDMHLVKPVDADALRTVVEAL